MSLIIIEALTLGCFLAKLLSQRVLGHVGYFNARQRQDIPPLAGQFTVDHQSLNNEFHDTQANVVGDRHRPLASDVCPVDQFYGGRHPMAQKSASMKITHSSLLWSPLRIS